MNRTLLVAVGTIAVMPMAGCGPVTIDADAIEGIQGLLDLWCTDCVQVVPVVQEVEWVPVVREVTCVEPASEPCCGCDDGDWEWDEDDCRWECDD